jgi:predicted phosphodiesterase
MDIFKRISCPSGYAQEQNQSEASFQRGSRLEPDAGRAGSAFQPSFDPQHSKKWAGIKRPARRYERIEATQSKSRGANLSKLIVHDHNNDGIDRRGFLQCMAWAGTGVIWSISGGIPTSRAFGQKMGDSKGDLNFVQISDSHIGFNKPANPDVNGTLQATIEKINSLMVQPEFIIHTGDLSHLAKASEFDTMDGILQGAKPKQIFYVPGEHDTSGDDGKQYLERYGKGTKGRGWYSFDQKGVHFVGLVNVGAQEGLGKLGDDQLEWLQEDLKARTASTPIVLFAHIPLWTLYPDWGWGTADSEQALGRLKRFGSVTVLNGHIHQVMQKVEGNVTFHTAMSTAFPQPAPGSAPAPGPMKVPSEKLRSVLGITNVQYVAKKHSLAVVDSALTNA